MSSPLFPTCFLSATINLHSAASESLARGIEGLENWFWVEGSLGTFAIQWRSVETLPLVCAI